MINLGGLSAAYPGYQAAEATQATTETNQAAAKEAALKLLGQHVLGRALTGGQPDQGPQPPAPGQPSAPGAPQGGGPAAPLAQGGPAPTPAPAASAEPATGKMPELTLQGLTERILATSPRVKDHPEILMAALERAKPLLDQQGQADLADLRERQLGETKRYHDILDSERGRVAAQNDKKIEQRDKALEQSAEREKRLAASAAISGDIRYQRLKVAQDDLDRKIKNGAFSQNMAAGKAEADAAWRYEQTYLKSNNAFTVLEDKEKEKFLADAKARYDARIQALEASGKSPQPSGGVTPPGQPVAPKIQGQVSAVPAGPAPAAAPAVQPPPVAMLKPGGVNIIDGVGWRLVNGQPVQVPIPGQ